MSFDERAVFKASQNQNANAGSIPQIVKDRNREYQMRLLKDYPHKDPLADPSNYTREHKLNDEILRYIEGEVKLAVKNRRSDGAKDKEENKFAPSSLGAYSTRLTQLQAPEEGYAANDDNATFMGTVSAATTGVCGDLVNWTSLPCEPTTLARLAYVFRNEARFPVILVYALVLVLIVAVIRYLAS